MNTSNSSGPLETPSPSPSNPSPSNLSPSSLSLSPSQSNLSPSSLSLSPSPSSLSLGPSPSNLSPSSLSLGPSPSNLSPSSLSLGPSPSNLSPSSLSLAFPSPSLVVDNGLIIPQIAAVLFLCIMVIATIFRKKIVKMAADYNRTSYHTVYEYDGEFPSDLPQIDVFSNSDGLQTTQETELTSKETEAFPSSEEV